MDVENEIDKLLNKKEPLNKLEESFKELEEQVTESKKTSLKIKQNQRFNIPIKRNSYDFCFYGGKGSGKTIAMTYYGFIEYLNGKKVYSNYKLEYPHIRIKNIEEIKNMQKGCALFDDIEAWSSSKFISNKDKKDLLECILNFGKKSITPFIWSCKRPLEIDKTLRGCGIDYFVKCNMLLKETPKDDIEYKEFSKYLDAHVIEMNIFRADDLTLDRVVYLDNLDIWSMLYETTEEVEQLGK